MNSRAANSSAVNSAPKNSAPKTKACAVCGKPQVERFRPFCSRRCADVDLHRWLSGAYALPATEEEDAVAGPP